jgi:hypothetical protein
MAAIALCGNLAAAQASSIIDLSQDVNGSCPSFIDLSGGNSSDCGRKTAQRTPESRTVGSRTAPPPNSRVRDLWAGPDPDQEFGDAQAAYSDQGREASRRRGAGVVYVRGATRRDGTEAKEQTRTAPRVRIRRR